MVNITEAHGVCLFCEDSATCTHHRGKIVVQCVDFRPATLAFAGSYAGLPGAPPVHSNAVGLCGTCTNISTCRLAKPIGGIWHCEDYSP